MFLPRNTSNRKSCTHNRIFRFRFLRKCSASGEWEDVGDDIAREKTSQVLRDAIQARKSFSGDGDRNTRDNATPNIKKRRKDPPHEMNKTPVKQSLQPNHQKTPTPVGSSNASLSLGFRPVDHAYSPGTLRLPNPYTSYGRVSDPSFNPRNSIEDAPHFSYQYPVTPSSSSIALSTARKRPRYCQESPLVRYHQYPYPTPIRSVPPRDTQQASMMFTTPPNTKTRGLVFSSPASIPRMASGYGDNNTDGSSSSYRCISTSQSTEKDYSNTEMARAPSAPIQQSKLTTDNNSGDNPDFDLLLNDEVLSDSDQKHHSTHLFPSDLQDDLNF